MSRKTARAVAMKLAFARLFGGEDTYEAILCFAAWKNTVPGWTKK